MDRSFRYVDGLAVAYLLVSGGLFLFGLGRGWVYPFCVGLHLGAVAVIVGLGRAYSLPAPLRIIRKGYPLLLLLGLYGEVDVLTRLLHEPPGFDALIRRWDLWFFGEHPHQHLDRWLAGRLWAEVFHGLYLAYYLLLIGAYLYAWRMWPTQLPRVAFVMTGIFASFIGFFVAFPVAGPLISPENALSTSGVFPRIVAWVYAPLRINGIHTGAFPSSHVGMSVAIGLLLTPRRWTGRMALAALVLGIAVSTVYGRFHYAIDAVVGLLMGGLLYALWTGLYDFLQSSPDRVAAPERAEEPTGPVPVSP